MLKDKIIDCLSDTDYTIRELSILLGSPESSIRARLSELRGNGFQITKHKKELTYYHLEEQKNKESEVLLQWLKENNMFFIRLNIESVSKKTGLSIDEIEMALSQLFKTEYSVIQMSKDSFIVREKLLRKN